MATHFRGIQVAPNLTAQDARDLFEQEPVNIVRYQFNPNYFDASIDIARTLLAEADGRGRKVIIDMHLPRAGADPVANGDDRAKFLNDWAEIVFRLSQYTALFAYGVLNEPAGSGENVNSLMAEAHNRLRFLDRDRKIIVTCPYSDPAQFDKTKKIVDQDVWYEAHMYLPFALTCQDLAGRPYPKKYPSGSWSLSWLISRLQKVINFQKEHRAQIYVGEFSIDTYAPELSRIRYLRDCIQIFEANGWNYSYHAWREAPVWDMEHYPAVRNVLHTAWSRNGV